MKFYPKFIAVSKNAKNPKEIVFRIDYLENAAINEQTGKKIQIDSIRKNYNVIRPLPCTIEEFARGVEIEEEATMENYNEYMKQFEESTEEPAEETVEIVEPEVETDNEETSPEITADEMPNEKHENEGNIETIEKLNDVEENDVSESVEEQPKKQPKVDEDFEPFPFGFPETRTYEHKKYGEVEEITFEYGEYMLKVICDPNSNGVKPIKRGCQVYLINEEKALIKTTSMTKALREMNIAEEDIKRAKKTIELAKHNMDFLVK